MNKRTIIAEFLGNFFRRKEEGKCPICEKDIKREDFSDPLSQREFDISGMCQDCQDNFFTED